MKPNKSIPLNPIDNLFNSFSEIATNDLDEAQILEIIEALEKQDTN